MWRNRRNPAGRPVDVPSIVAALFAAAVLGVMVWMAITGNYFCCDPKSLVSQLRRQLFTGP
jgi:hypothetical protein